MQFLFSSEEISAILILLYHEGMELSKNDIIEQSALHFEAAEKPVFLDLTSLVQHEVVSITQRDQKIVYVIRTDGKKVNNLLGELAAQKKLSQKQRELLIYICQAKT